MTKESICEWIDLNDKQIEKAADILADGLIRDIVGDLDEDEVLRNATDLGECDGHDFSLFFSLVQMYWERGIDVYREKVGALEKNPYNIKEFNKKNVGYGAMPDVFLKWLNDNYRDELPHERLFAIDKRCEMAHIVNANAFGGGGFEESIDLFRMVRENIVEKIKKHFKV